MAVLLPFAAVLAMLCMTSGDAWDVGVVGGGAAGFFSAVECARVMPKGTGTVTVFEGLKKSLSKVEISGGGRCNVMHDATKTIRVISQGYPRGEKQLLGPFSAGFGPSDTRRWFTEHGVQLKTEPDGRMFPVTDSSQTVIDALQAAARAQRVRILCEHMVSSVELTLEGFILRCRGRDESWRFDRLVFATGSSREGYRILESLGHTLKSPIPSLFTFNIKDPALNELAGLSVSECEISIAPGQVDKKQVARLRGRHKQVGPVLFTHTGLSGPAILKLSAYCAELLAELKYSFDLEIQWTPALSDGQLREVIHAHRQQYSTRSVGSAVPLESIDASLQLPGNTYDVNARDGKGLMPRRLWRYLLEKAQIDPATQWAQLTQRDTSNLLGQLRHTVLRVSGRGSYRDEFVTCGGVPLTEIDLKSMHSTVIPGLYLCGEVIDIDGITGGYNFQSAWTTGWIAGHACGTS